MNILEEWVRERWARGDLTEGLPHSHDPPRALSFFVFYIVVKLVNTLFQRFQISAF